MLIGFSKYSEKNDHKIILHHDPNTFIWRMYWWNVKDT